jgi:hypothetical protein
MRLKDRSVEELSLKGEGAGEVLGDAFGASKRQSDTIWQNYNIKRNSTINSTNAYTAEAQNVHEVDVDQQGSNVMSVDEYLNQRNIAWTDYPQANHGESGQNHDGQYYNYTQDPYYNNAFAALQHYQQEGGNLVEHGAGPNYSIVSSHQPGANGSYEPQYYHYSSNIYYDHNGYQYHLSEDAMPLNNGQSQLVKSNEIEESARTDESSKLL